MNSGNHSHSASSTALRLSNGRPSSYGLGWFVSLSDRGRVVEHDGGWQGFSTAMIRYLDEGLSATVLADLDGFDAPNLAVRLAAAASPRPLTPSV